MIAQWSGRLAGAFLLILAAGLAMAQGNPFAPVVIVNDKAVTGFELEQRKTILRLFRTPGDLDAAAREALIDERLQLFAAERLGLVLSEEEVEEGMAEFAGRANLTTEEFLDQLATAGVAEQSFREFVRAGATWRQVVRGRFGPRAQVTEAEIDRALALTSRRGGAEAFINEIILPARNPEEAAQSEAIAAELSQTVSGFGAFAAAARRVSVSGTRENGGRVDQPVPISNLPPQLRSQILTLAPGDVSDPVPIPNAIAVFQLRELRETGLPNPESVSLEYAQYFIPGGRTEETLREADRVARRVDTCDDLYGINHEQDPARLEREARAVTEIPQDILFELAKLDEGEYSTNLSRGNNLVFLMLCGRTEILEEEADRRVVRQRLVNQRLAAYGDGFLAELRADAIIREP